MSAGVTSFDSASHSPIDRSMKASMVIDPVVLVEAKFCPTFLRETIDEDFKNLNKLHDKIVCLFTCVRTLIMLHHALFDIQTGQPCEFTVPFQLSHSFCRWKWCKFTRCHSAAISIVKIENSADLTVSEADEAWSNASFCKFLK